MQLFYYKSGEVFHVTGFEFSKISRQSAHEGAKVVSPTHRLPLPPKEVSLILIPVGGTRWHSWLRHCATSRKVAGSIPDCVIGFFSLT